MPRKNLFLLICALPFTLAAQSRPAYLAGNIVDEKGQPLALVNVQALGSFDGSVTDANGRFFFVARKHGAAQIRASLLGYENAEQSVQLVAGDTTRLTLMLRETLINFQETVVTASAYTTGDEGKGVTLRGLESRHHTRRGRGYFSRHQNFSRRRDG